jgi:hypothetical protein
MTMPISLKITVTMTMIMITTIMVGMTRPRATMRGAC